VFAQTLRLTDSHSLAQAEANKKTETLEKWKSLGMPMVCLCYFLLLSGLILLVCSSMWYYYYPSTSVVPRETYYWYGVFLTPFCCVIGVVFILVNIAAWYHSLPRKNNVSPSLEGDTNGNDTTLSHILHSAGIQDRAFLDMLLSAGLDLKTLRMVVDDTLYVDSLLKEVGISMAGHRVRIIKALMNPV
jgi:hypothetical protein